MDNRPMMIRSTRHPSRHAVRLHSSTSLAAVLAFALLLIASPHAEAGWKAGLAKSDLTPKADVWLGKEAMVALVIEKEMLLTLARKARRKMKVSVIFENPVPAPIAKGDKVARLVVSVPGDEPIEVPLLAAKNVERLGLIGRLGKALKAIIWGESG